MHIYIQLDKPNQAYQPGEAISGKVFVTSDSEKTTRGIKVKISGQSKVKWREQVGTGDNRRTVTRSDVEDHYNLKLWVFGNGDRINLTAGQHTFPFALELPNHIPGSFEGKYGYVRHQCSAKVVRDWAIDDKCTLPFSVNPIYDLNLDPRSRAPIALHDEKTLGCCCWESPPVSITLRIDHTGFVCGEPIIINAECSNPADKPMNFTSAEIKQKITFIAKSRKKTTSRQVCEIRRGQIPAGKDDIWSGERLVVPAVPPSRLPGCSIIDIEYTLKFAMNPSGMSTELDIKVPIIIGTIPLNQVVTTYFRPPTTIPSAMPALPPTGFAPTAPNMEKDTPPAYSELPELPPPSYNTCVYGIEKMSDDEDDSAPTAPFSPFYVTYDFPALPPSK